MDLPQIKADLKLLVVRELNLQGCDPVAIQDDAPLFGDAANALGLDSLDALQLAISVEERFGVTIPEGDAARSIFQSIASLAQHVLISRNEAGR